VYESEIGSRPNKRLLQAGSADSLRGKRNRAMLAMLIGCGLRRAELLGLTVLSIHLREEDWVIADLVGKGCYIRTVPIPLWVKTAVDAWTEAAQIREGCVFRSINKADRIWGNGMTPKVLWEVVKDAAGQAGIEKLAPYDLRRTCARLCHLAGAENSTRFSSCWDTSRSKRRSDTSDASNDCVARSMTNSESSPLNRSDRRRGGFDRPLPTFEDLSAVVAKALVRDYRLINQMERLKTFGVLPGNICCNSTAYNPE